MKKLSIFIAVCTLLLSGCLSYQPVPEQYSGPLSTIKDSSSPVSDTKVHFFQLRSVDGRQVETSTLSTSIASDGMGAVINVVEEQREVPATTSVLLIEGTTHVAMPIMAFFGKMYNVSGEVSVALEPDQTYIVKGTLSENYSAVWLEDSQGNVVSEKIEK